MASLPFDPSLLSTFLAVIELGTISAAAKALHLSQPAVTAQVRKLEDELKTPLFVRSVHGVTPTEAGLRLARHARTIRGLLEAAVNDVAGAEEPHGPLSLAASTTIAAHVLPPLLARFRAVHRGTPFEVHIGNSEHVVREVREGRIPLGLVEGHRRASGVRLEPFVDDEIVLVLGRDAPFQVRKAVELDTTPILWRESGSGTRAVVERALARAGLRRRRSRGLDVELGSTEAILGGAAAGLGVAFVSRWSVRAYLAAGLVKIASVPDLVVRRTFHWALPAGALTGAAARFYDFAQRSPPL